MSSRARRADSSETLLRRTRFRLAGLTMLTVTSLVIVVGVITAATATALMRESIDRALDAAVFDPLTLHELFEDESEFEYVGPLGEADTFVMLVDADGNVYGNTTFAYLPGLPEMDAIARTGAEPDRRTGRFGTTDLRLLTVELGAAEISDEIDATTTLYLQAGHDLSLQRQLEQQLLLAIFLIALLGIGGAAVVTLFVTKRALVPIKEAFATERRFVAAASHELRTPVAIIRASAEILEREQLIEPQGSPLMADIIGETDRLGRLVADLMALASAEAGAISLEPRRLELSTYYDDLARRAKSMVEGVDLRFASSLATLPPGTSIDADPDRLDQLLLILVDNAIGHSPPDGTVRMSLSPEPAGHVTFAVGDDGPGVLDDDLQRIFEPFTRATRGTSAEREGSGLGLAIAQQLATRHHATLSVSSEPGHGATFELRLPLAGDKPAQAPARPS